MTNSNKTHFVLGLFVCFLLFPSLRAISQHYPQLSQYMFNRYAINPAYGGLESSLSITAAIRSQWSQYPGAPKSQMINAHLPFYILNGSLGVAVENEQLGVSQRQLVSFSYNYVYETYFGLISFGARAGMQQVSFDNSEIRTPDGQYLDNVFDHRDPLLNSSDLSGFAPVWGLGLYVVAQDLEFGVTLDNFPENGFRAGGSQFESSRFVTTFVTYNYPIDESVVVTPSLLVKSDFVQTQTDIGVLGSYNRVFGGFTFRGYNSDSVDALNVIIGSKLTDHLRVSYSFDIGLSGLRQYHDGTHEFVLNYNLNKKIKTGELPRIIYNPRYN